MPEIAKICIDYSFIGPGALQQKFCKVQPCIVGNGTLLLPMQYQFGGVVHPALKHCGTVLFIEWKFLQVQPAIECGLNPRGDNHSAVWRNGCENILLRGAYIRIKFRIKPKAPSQG